VDELVDGWTDRWMNGLIDGEIGWIDGQIDECLNWRTDGEKDEGIAG
jgi:hypothetical protein